MATVRWVIIAFDSLVQSAGSPALHTAFSVSKKSPERACCLATGYTCGKAALGPI